MYDFFFSLFDNFRWIDILDVFFVYIIIYFIITLIKGTRAVQMLTGLGIVAIGYYLSYQFKLYTLHFLLKEFFDNLFLIIVVLFQDDIRRALSKVGRNPFGAQYGNIEDFTKDIDEIIRATVSLAQRQIGAIIVLAKNTGLNNYINMGSKIDSKISSELITSIFMPSSPMHDGAIIIQKGRIIAAGCLLPLSGNPNLDKAFGTRHRAAIGMTEETDAIAIIISEERSEISLAEHGNISRRLDSLTLRKMLLDNFNISNTQKEEKKLEGEKNP